MLGLPLRWRCRSCGGPSIPVPRGGRPPVHCPACGERTESVPLVRPGAAVVALLVAGGLAAWSLPQLWAPEPPRPPMPDQGTVASAPDGRPWPPAD
ncbi:hypothetical protein [Synechococcus sp. RSCCF101]|uniref:hypothetical protein n=1 Tax=Synechococcus sp. RSCCF101 TaxID=2511069 RepID=UPI0012470CF0|nr:hypothetical protein [Synechococcus sp. RSCCF101]